MGIGFQSLQEHIDTTSPGEKLVFHIFGCSPSSSATSSRSGPRPGWSGAGQGAEGRGAQSLTAQQRALALDLYTQRKHTVEEICRTLGISKPILYAYERGAASKP